MVDSFLLVCYLLFLFLFGRENKEEKEAKRERKATKFRFLYNN